MDFGQAQARTEKERATAEVSRLCGCTDTTSKPSSNRRLLIVAACVGGLAVGMLGWNPGTVRSDAARTAEQAVLIVPFQALSADANTRHLESERISQELVGSLFRHGGIRVYTLLPKLDGERQSGPSPVAAYVVSGSVTTSDEGIRGLAQPLDETGKAVWTKTYVQPAAPGSPTDFQKGLAEEIAAAVGQRKKLVKTSAGDSRQPLPHSNRIEG